MDDQNNQDNHIVQVTRDELVEYVMSAVVRFMRNDAGIMVALTHILTHCQVIGDDGAVLMSFATTPDLLQTTIVDILNRITVFEVDHDPEHTIEIDDITVAGVYPEYDVNPET